MAKGLSSLLDSLDELEDYAPSLSFGTISDKREGKPSPTQSEDISTKNECSNLDPQEYENGSSEKKKKDKSGDLFDDGFLDDDSDDWLETVGKLKIKKGSKVTLEGLMDDVGRPKKKKKKKKGETDFQKIFSSELASLQKLSADQIAFTDSLQRRYDTMEGTKSSSRGLSKYTTDLIMSINTARSTALSVTNAIAGIKKNIHDLHLKEMKELGLNKGNEEDLDKYASGFLNSIVNKVGRNAIVSAVPSEGDPMYDQIPEYTDDDIAEDLMEGIQEDDNGYLKYEKDKVQVKILYNQNTGDWNFAAMDAAGNIIPDYPLPNPEELNMRWNKGAGFGSDQFSRRYPIVLVDN